MVTVPLRPVREQSARRFLGIAATLGVLGIAFNLNSDDSTLPKVLAVVGLVAVMWSIHRFGRLGPDETIVFEPDEAEATSTKKKKKKKRAAQRETSGPGPDEPQAS